MMEQESVPITLHDRGGICANYSSWQRRCQISISAYLLQAHIHALHDLTYINVMYAHEPTDVHAMYAPDPTDVHAIHAPEQTDVHAMYAPEQTDVHEMYATDPTAKSRHPFELRQWSLRKPTVIISRFCSIVKKKTN